MSAAVVAVALTTVATGGALVARGFDGSAASGLRAVAAQGSDTPSGELGQAADASTAATRRHRAVSRSTSGIRNPLRAIPVREQTPTRAKPRAVKVIDSGPPIARIPLPKPSDPFTFRIGTFNILGSNHTRGSRRWAAGTTRAGFTASLVQGYGLDLVGFQEVQDDQLNVLNARLAGYSIWPSRALGNNGVRLQIAFRDSMFELVDTLSFPTIFAHQYRPIPVVLLRNRVTGGEFYYMNIHNSPGGMAAERAAAKRVQIAQLNALLATGRPVLLGGDMNERGEFMCQVGAATGTFAANGGSPSPCVLPPPPVKIDWIMGGGGVSFSDYALGAGGLVARTSDHEFPQATVTVTP